MIVDYSPFTPGLPVPIELFVGRENEIGRLSEHVREAVQGRLRLAFLSGERGIGKSSLAAYIKAIAEREHNMLSAHVMLGGANTVDELVRRVFESVMHESKEKKWYDSVKDFFGKTVRNVDLFGIKFTFAPEQDQLTALTRNFAQALLQLTGRLASEKRAVGFMLILDNINGLAESKPFADWIKSLIDDIAINCQMPLCILLVGTDERRQSLIELNPSLARSFDMFNIRPWTDGDTAKFFTEAFGSVGVTIDKGAMQVMVRYAGGMPSVAHEIGDAALREDADKKIDVHDATRGIVSAAEVVGQKYIRHQVLNAIKSKKYKTILQDLVGAHATDLKFERSELMTMLPHDEVGVDNFLRRMKELGVIVADDDEGVGCYKFSSYILATYVFMTANSTAQSSAKPTQ